MRNAPKITPPLRATSMPNLWEIPEDDFEELCVALLEAEAGVRVPNLIGTKGQQQFGADIVAQIADGYSLVGQCKCYKKFLPSDIRDAAEEFLKHSTYWQSFKVSRFILFVACDLREIRRQEQIRRQRDLFSTHGIDFEAWDLRTITTKLAAAPTTVHRILSRAWVEKLCGHVLELVIPADSPATRSDALIAAQVPHLMAFIDDRLSRDVEEIQNLRSGGKSVTALARVERIKGDGAVWPHLGARRRAQLLRLEASMRLHGPAGVEAATGLADEADALHPADNPLVLRATIAWRGAGPEQALQVIEGATTTAGRLLKAAMLVALDHHAEAKAVLDGLGPEAEGEAEFWRLRALCHLSERSIEAALANIAKATELAPDSRNLRVSRAMLLYYSALSPAAVPRHLLTQPEPAPWMMVRRDDEARRRLAEAESLFVRFAVTEEPPHLDMPLVGLWRLACLACDANRIEEATEECVALLHADRTDAVALAWAMAREFAINWERSRQALDDLVAARRADLSQVLALASLHLRAKRGDKARTLLDAQSARFTTAGERAVLDRWMTLVAGERSSQSGEASDGGDFADLAAKALAAGDGYAFAGYCEELARAEQWRFIADHAEDLCRQVGTAGAVDLAAWACCQADRFAKCCEILQENVAAFPGGVLPHGLRRMLIAAQQRSGQLKEALNNARALASQRSDVNDSMNLATLYLQVGDLATLARTVEPLRRQQRLPVDRALVFASALARTHPQVARALVADIVPEEMDSAALPQAFALKLQLGLQDDTDPIGQAFHQAAAAGQIPGVQMVDVSDIPRLMEQIRQQRAQAFSLLGDGRVPVHSVAQATGTPLCVLFHDRLLEVEAGSDLREAPRLLIRYGGRAPIDIFPPSASQWRLHVDLTGLLLAHHLDLLDTVEQCFGSLRISPRVPLALLEMGGEVNPTLASWTDALRERVSVGIESGLYQFTPAYAGDAEEPHGPTEATLYDLLAVKGQDGGVVWSDDRMVNSHPGINGAAIVTVHDILLALRHYGSLSDQNFFRTLLRLRAGNACFLPPTAEEILHQFAKAEIRDGMVVETPELAILRRHLAASVMAESPLRPAPQPSDPVHPYGEAPFLAAHRRAVTDALLGLWKERAQPFTVSAARADWIWRNLWVEHYPQMALWGRSTEQQDALQGTHLGGLFSSAYFLDRTGNGESPRSTYLDWAMRRVLWERMSASPEMIGSLCLALQLLIGRAMEMASGEAEVEAFQRELRIFVRALPKPLSSRFAADADVKRQLGMGGKTLIPVLGEYFDCDAFALALEDAARGATADLPTWDGNRCFVVSMAARALESADDVAFIFVPVDGKGETIRLAGLENAAFLPATERTAFFANRKDLPDLPESERHLLAELLLADGNAFERFDRLHAAILADCDLYYPRLAERLAAATADEPIEYECLMPPSGVAMLHYLRLWPSDDPATMLENGARRLIEDRGVVEALWRFASLPVPLPNVLIERLSVMSESERQELLGTWDGRPCTHLAAFHYLHIFTRFGLAEDRIATVLDSLMTDPSRAELHVIFVRVLKGAWDRLGEWPDASLWSFPLRLALAWCHADKLMVAFLAAGQCLETPRRRLTLRNLLDAGQCRGDVAEPSSLSEALFYIQGLAYGLGEHAHRWLTPSVADALKVLATNAVDGQISLCPALMVDHSAALNVLGSFLAAPVDPALMQLQINDVAGLGSAPSLHVQMAGYLDEASATDRMAIAWMGLFTLYPLGRFPTDLAPRVRAFILEMDVPALWRHEPLLGRSAVSYAAEVVARSGDESLRAAFLTRLLEGRTSLADGADATDEDVFVAAVITLALAEESLSAFANTALAGLSRLIEALPSAASAVRKILPTVCDALPLAEARILWPLLISSRAGT